MKYSVHFDEDTGVCLIRVTGPHRRPEDSYELLRIGAAAAKEHGGSRYIFDMREAEIITDTMGTYDAASNPEKWGFSRHYRIAAVYREITEDHRFLETVGFNRGASGFRVFDDIDRAWEWVK